MDEIAHADPHVEIERLEARIEELAAKLESCRKFVLAARFAMVLGGIVVSGSNASTAKEASAELAMAERDRAAMIGLIELRTVGEQATLH